MTKKVLVPIDINNPQKKFNDFLYPDPSDQRMVLKGIKNDKTWEYGMVILTSEINENDVFKEIVDSGKRIKSVSALLAALKEYMDEMPKYKIGNVLKLNNERAAVDFKIEFERLTRKK
jgi:hypothetical protein